MLTIEGAPRSQAARPLEGPLAPLFRLSPPETYEVTPCGWAGDLTDLS